MLWGKYKQKLFINVDFLEVNLFCVLRIHCATKAATEEAVKRNFPAIQQTVWKIWTLRNVNVLLGQFTQFDV